MLTSKGDGRLLKRRQTENRVRSGRLRRSSCLIHRQSGGQPYAKLVGYGRACGGAFQAPFSSNLCRPRQGGFFIASSRGQKKRPQRQGAPRPKEAWLATVTQFGSKLARVG